MRALAACPAVRPLLPCLLAPLALLAAETARPPNVILLFVDDLGYADIGPFGNQTLRTPHLDRFAREGMRFTSFYATPVCSMSRASLLTGCYSARRTGSACTRTRSRWPRWRNPAATPR